MKKFPVALKVFIVVLPLLLMAVAYWFFYQHQPAPPMTVQQKKQRFKDLVAPAVSKVYASLMQEYQDVSGMVSAPSSQKQLATLARLRDEYRVANNVDLLMAIKPHPPSITMAQAAMESAWATSRFFKQGKNVFGVWSFDENEPRIAAGQQRGDKTIWLKKYASVEASIRDYYRTLARGHAFKSFRQLKMQTDDPHRLVTKLDKYSEKGAEYGKELSAIIRFNHFEEYDRR